MGLQLHERTMMIQKSYNEFTTLFLDFVQRYDLTYGELVGMLSREMSTIAKLMIREERHPDNPDKKGDEA